MSEEIYITGPVIVNGIPDTDGDTLNSTEIRTIFTKYTDHLSDIQHDRIDYEGVDVLANWISEEDTNIKGNTIPAKSWLCTMKVTNPETITAIKNGELTCFSLGSVSREGKTREGWFINKRISYHDLQSMEDVIPLRISIVDRGACGFPFMIETREIYINKNKEKEKMTDNNPETSEAKFSFKEWLGIEKHFRNSIEKAEDNTPAPASEVTNDADKTIDELFKRLDTIESKLDKILAEPEPEPEPESATIDKETEETGETTEENEKDINKNTEETVETAEETTENKETDINKSVTEKPADIPVTTETKSNFYTNTGRDHFGRKLRR